jgi:hypothetical protein
MARFFVYMLCELQAGDVFERVDLQASGGVAFTGTSAQICHAVAGVEVTFGDNVLKT